MDSDYVNEQKEIVKSSINKYETSRAKYDEWSRINLLPYLYYSVEHEIKSGNSFANTEDLPNLKRILLNEYSYFDYLSLGMFHKPVPVSLMYEMVKPIIGTTERGVLNNQEFFGSLNYVDDNLINNYNTIFKDMFILIYKDHYGYDINIDEIKDNKAISPIIHKVNLAILKKYRDSVVNELMVNRPLAHDPLNYLTASYLGGVSSSSECLYVIYVVTIIIAFILLICILHKIVSFSSLPSYPRRPLPSIRKC
jgi:hypothetical protein